MAYSFGRFALDDFALVTSGVGVRLREPCNGRYDRRGRTLGPCCCSRVASTAYSCGRFAPLDIFRTRDVRGGRVPVEPATGATTDGRGTLRHLLMIMGRVDGVLVDVRAPLALRIEAEA